ncbi:H+-ATPase G subunit-domain-containing protein [Thelephora terrestris]|uniref:V-type proton ATPase subunit G n=1 Tax=Thelephora terrestris TaxID=56493 RepID=A0A9P6L6V9_9AGAM|nr:H+-ATPase G subunit-domain-containing protein [Thelephora terrestris]
MAGQSQNIQTLLEAEKEAQKLVQQSRQYRTQRLKDAHSEATKEIEDYKAQKEQEFKSYEASHTGNTQSVQATVDKETDAKLRVISQQYEKNKDAVVKKLLDRVILVQPELHRNLEKLEE